MNTPKKSIFIRSVIIIALILSVISYLLADRYLIEHIEISDVKAAAVIVEDASVATLENTPEVEEAVSTGTIVADDWNYQSDDLSISLREVSTGSGQDTVTYFVADILFKDATQLESAFADDSFGRNIIEYTSIIAQENNALFAINGDYYGFRSDGIVIRNGIIYRDIPVRIGLAIYKDGSMKIYDEAQTSAQQLVDDGVWNTMSFGPALIENSIIASNLGIVEIDTNFGNHSIQGANPRTGVGVIDNNHFIFIVVDGRSSGYSRGLTLTEFAQVFKDLGCTDAYNIDGGGSSTMFFMGRVVNNPLGKNKERGTSDILFISS